MIELFKKWVLLFMFGWYLGGILQIVFIPLPPPIKVIAPTEQSIKEDIRRERLEKQYHKAAIAARAVYRRVGCRQTFSDSTGRVAVDFGISPRILAALVFIESSCNPSAGYRQASVGLTAVNTTVWKYSKQELLNPNRNLEIGASILAPYIHKYGLIEGLHHYNGMKDPTDSYSTKVLTAAGIRS